MNMRKSFDRFLDRVINALCWETIAELHIQRIMKAYGHHLNNNVAIHYEKEMTGGLTTIEPTIEDMELTEINPIVIEDAEQATKVTTMV